MTDHRARAASFLHVDVFGSLRGIGIDAVAALIAEVEAAATASARQEIARLTDALKRAEQVLSDTTLKDSDSVKRHAGLFVVRAALAGVLPQEGAQP